MWKAHRPRGLQYTWRSFPVNSSPCLYIVHAAYPVFSDLLQGLPSVLCILCLFSNIILFIFFLFAPLQLTFCILLGRAACGLKVWFHRWKGYQILNRRWRKIVILIFFEVPRIYFVLSVCMIQSMIIQFNQLKKKSNHNMCLFNYLQDTSVE